LSTGLQKKSKKAKNILMRNKAETTSLQIPKRRLANNMSLLSRKFLKISLRILS